MARLRTAWGQPPAAPPPRRAQRHRSRPPAPRRRWAGRPPHRPAKCTRADRHGARGLGVRRRAASPRRTAALTGSLTPTARLRRRAPAAPPCSHACPWPVGDWWCSGPHSESEGAPWLLGHQTARQARIRQWSSRRRLKACLQCQRVSHWSSRPRRSGRWLRGKKRPPPQAVAAWCLGTPRGLRDWELQSPIQYYTILDYTRLYYAILWHTIIYYDILCYDMLCYALIYYTILYYDILYYTILYYTILYYNII